MGGPSAEHEISLQTGATVTKYLDPNRFSVVPVKIGKDGSWPMSLDQFRNQVDVAFITLHGYYGEDGQVQNLLETFKIPYTGSDPIASAIAMDKDRTLKLIRSHCLIPDYKIIARPNPAIYREIIKPLKPPLVIKPVSSGSSFGISLVKKWLDLNTAIAKAFDYSNQVMAQKYISGKEMSCGVLEINGADIPLVPTEIIPNQGEFFNHQSKYQVGGSKEITPPNLPLTLIKKIQQTALLVHKIIDCSGLSRTDMILDKKNNLYVLETNTIPGFTKTSLVPQQAAALGLPLSKVLECLIQSAYEKRSGKI